MIKKLSDYKLALASSSPRELIDIFLDKSQLHDIFDFVISGEEVKNSKPNPEIFLKCSQYFNIKPEECLVIEDSVTGVQAAKSANMKCIAIVTSHKKEELSKADLVLDDLSNLDLNII